MSAAVPDWDVRLPGEFIHQPMMRTIFASVAVCLDEMGEPLTPAQIAILDAAVASSGTDHLAGQTARSAKRAS